MLEQSIAEVESQLLSSSSIARTMGVCSAGVQARGELAVKQERVIHPEAVRGGSRAGFTSFGRIRQSDQY